MKINRNFLYGIIIILLLPLAFYFGFYKEAKNYSNFNYSVDGTIDYQVCLKENDLYDDSCLTSNMSYVLSAIESLDIYYNYNFTSDQKSNNNYTYSIEAVLNIYERNNSSNVLFTKTFDIVTDQSGNTENNNVVVINENITINYDEYLSIVNNFKDEYNVTVDSDITFNLIVNNESSNSEMTTPVNTASTIGLTVPLTGSTITMKTSVPDSSKVSVIINESYTLDFMLFITILIIMIFFIILLSINVINKESKLSPYEKKLKSILKNYDRMIVSATTNVKVEEENYEEIIDVTLFKELVDIAEQLTKVITWTEVLHKDKLRVSWFSLEDGRRLYRYIIKSSDENID